MKTDGPIAAVFAVGTAVEVRLDNGEWAAARITTIRTPSANDSGSVRCVEQRRQR